ncbi:MAG: PAS domain-containing protein [Alphaproteobacteria bacterium]
MTQIITPTGVERFFNIDEIIVSKTNPKGHMTYINRVFMDISGYKEHELLDQPHSLIRHPDMPRCIFKLLWDTLQSKKEIFAYVVNMCKNGDHYWVLAHVTPSYDAAGHITGYHSNRRVPNREIIDNTIIPLYKLLIEEEKRHSNRKEGMNTAFQSLLNILEEKGMEYDEFIFSLQN